MPAGPPVDSDEEAVVAGTLRSPWKWEELIVESAVVGGRSRQDGKARWRRRLDGLAADYRYRIGELERDEPESPRMARFARDLRNLSHLRQFALPIIDVLAAWPERATWGQWLDRFSALAASALGRPERVLRMLAELRPMADVGPVTIEEARDVLHDRLVALDWEPPARRYGRLFVGTPHQARGRSFRVVFVPGLAERVVPQRPREDPLLLDGGRAALDPALCLPGRTGKRRAPAVEDRDRCCKRAALPVLSAARRGGNPRARTVVLRARRRARDDGQRARPSRARGGGRRGSRRESGVASSRRSGSGHRRSRARPRVAAAIARFAGSGGGQGPGPLPARPQRRTAPIRHQPLGARPRRMVGQRWPGHVVSGHPTGARSAAVEPPALFVVGASAVRDLPVPVCARDDLSPRAVGRARASRPHGSVDARQPVSSDAGRVLSRARRGARAADHAPGAAACDRDPRCRARSCGRRVRRDARARDRAGLARRNRRPAARPGHLGAEAGGRGRVGAEVLRVQLRSER